MPSGLASSPCYGLVFFKDNLSEMLIYLKPFRPSEECLDIMLLRGLEVPDRQHALRSLRRIGYYRLSAFSYPFRDFCPVHGKENEFVRCDKFRAGTHFDQVINFYLFDKSLRILLLDAIERIEVALRTTLIDVIGKQSSYAHRDPRTYKKRFSQVDENGNVPLHQFIEGLDRHFARSKEEFAKHFRATYPGRPPIWIEAGTWDWGNLAHIVANLDDKHKDAIATRIHPDLRRKTFSSWVTALNEVRNGCAHHSRIWNKPLVNSPGVPPKGTIPELDHLRQNRDGDDAPTKRIYSAIVVMTFLLRSYYPRSEWHIRVKDTLLQQELPDPISMKTAGFPDEWAAQPIWSSPAGI